MEASHAHEPSTEAPAEISGPRLVLISADDPDGGTQPSPNEIIGTEQHIVGSGGFCLTDR